ncbi:MAG: ABC transporter permease subunit [Spirochaetes bacterium]|nr:ABC transporter permease subunit [Spirochaetota bacterium]
MVKRRGHKLITHILLIVIVLITAFPVLFALITSTLSFKDAFVFPPIMIPGGHFISNAVEAWNRVNMGRLFLNSLFISIVVAVVKITLSLMAAFAFTHFKFVGRNLLFPMSMITQMLPLPVRIIPTFELMNLFHWINTYYALTVPFFASTTGILLFRQFFLTIPRDLSDAARVDGVKPMRYFFQVIVPISRTNISALFVIEFIFMWSQYLWPLVVINSANMRVIQIGLKMLLASEQIAPEWNIIMAGTIIAMLFPLLVLIIFRKSFSQGIAMQTDK